MLGDEFSCAQFQRGTLVPCYLRQVSFLQQVMELLIIMRRI